MPSKLEQWIPYRQEWDQILRDADTAGFKFTTEDGITQGQVVAGLGPQVDAWNARIRELQAIYDGIADDTAAAPTSRDIPDDEPVSVECLAGEWRALVLATAGVPLTDEAEAAINTIRSAI